MTRKFYPPLRPRWDGYLASEFRRIRPHERIEADDKRLKEIFALADKIPIFQEALDWARTHGVQFLVDRTCWDVGGYYMPGTGIVTISKNQLRHGTEIWAVRALVHEIRHAWQDYYGLLNRDLRKFYTDFAHTALIEADAMAFECLAKEQHMAAEFPQACKLPENQDDFLWKSFKQWYSSYRAELYGDGVIKLHGAYQWRIPTVTPPRRNYEFIPYVRRNPWVPILDLSSLQDLRRLGRGFKRGNYFPREAREFLPRTALASSLVHNFYNAANGNQKKLVTEVQKREKQRSVYGF